MSEDTCAFPQPPELVLLTPPAIWANAEEWCMTDEARPKLVTHEDGRQELRVHHGGSVRMKRTSKTRIQAEAFISQYHHVIEVLLIYRVNKRGVSQDVSHHFVVKYSDGVWIEVPLEIDRDVRGNVTNLKCLDEDAYWTIDTFAVLGLEARNLIRKYEK